MATRKPYKKPLIWDKRRPFEFWQELVEEMKENGLALAEMAERFRPKDLTPDNLLFARQLADAENKLCKLWEQSEAVWDMCDYLVIAESEA